jgi:hypothetical protein
MTIRMLQAWNGLHQQKIVTTLSGSDEAALVAAGIATYDLDGPADNLRMAQFATDAGGAVLGISHPTSGGIITLAAGVSSGYFCHAYAPNQITTDDKFFDLLAISDGARGAHLSVAQLWANAGYASTLDPSAGVADSGIAFPALAWDWFAGESLIIFWRGKITPEGANTSMMGQAYTATQKGWQIRALATGQADLVFRAGDGATSVFATSTPNVVGRVPFVSGEEHSFMLAMDGANRLARWYVDGELSTQAPVAAFDCYNATHATKLGSAAQTPTTADGLATQTKALVVLKGRVGQSLPGNIDTLARRLHRSPYRLITSDLW